MQDNQYYKNSALAALKGNWAPALVVTIVYFAIAVLSFGGQTVAQLFQLSPKAFLAILAGVYVLYFLLLFPAMVGYMNAFRTLYETGDNKLTTNLFHFGFGNWAHVAWGYFLMFVKTMLWTLLFIVPGIIKSFAYVMTPFILVEHPEMKAIDAIHLSQDMMRGHKFDYFYLLLTFIGWGILAVLTLGLGFLWLLPYMMTTMAAFYNDLKKEKGEITGVSEL